MPVTIRKMTAAEFDVFYKWSMENHAAELMADLQISRENAIPQAVAELDRMLPNGPATPHHNLMTIVAAGKSVGFIWTIYENQECQTQCFVCDFAIWEPMRRKGYGNAALGMAEKAAVAAGCQEAVLYARDDNTAAKALYAKCGYRVLRQSGRGKYMVKQLPSPPSR